MVEMDKGQLEKYLNNREKELSQDVKYYEKQLRNVDKKSFYYDSYVKTIQKLNAKREIIREILDYIDMDKEVDNRTIVQVGELEKKFEALISWLEEKIKKCNENISDLTSLLEVEDIDIEAKKDIHLSKLIKKIYQEVLDRAKGKVKIISEVL